MFHFKTLKRWAILIITLIIPITFNSCEGFKGTPIETQSSLSNTKNLLQDLKALALSSNEIKLTWNTQENDDLIFTILRNDQLIATTIDTSFNDLGLIANTTYSYEVIGSYIDTSKVFASSVITITTLNGNEDNSLDQTDSGSAESLWFEDGFESGNLSKSTTRSDSTWTWSTNSSSGGVIRPSSTITRSGNYSIEAMYDADSNGDDSHPELVFNFGKSMSEVWVEYYVYYPTNYYHRTQSSSSNNKFLQLGYQMLTIESAAAGDGTSDMRRFLSVTQRPNGTNNWRVSDSDTSKFIGPGSEYAIQLGQWTQIRVHYKSGSDGIKNDGYAAIFINGELYHALNWPFWEPNNFGHINKGYLPGWSNSGFTQQTSIYIDDFKLYDKNPGW